MRLSAARSMNRWLIFSSSRNQQPWSGWRDVTYEPNADSTWPIPAATDRAQS